VVGVVVVGNKKNTRRIRGKKSGKKLGTIKKIKTTLACCYYGKKKQVGGKGWKSIG